MNLKQRIELLTDLGNYMLSDHPEWQAAKHRAFLENPWFIPEFIEKSASSIATQFLDRERLEAWLEKYLVPLENSRPKNLGIVLAGNLPLVGFHDMLCAFITGHRQTLKPSSKDSVLPRHLAAWLSARIPQQEDQIAFADMLKGCDAYIATGSNNAARYFEYYFGKYPHIIRSNRTSVAVLDGTESREDLEKLADDVYLYYGLGCRNVTKIYVPLNYDFVPLLDTFNRYAFLADNNKYKNNYDYQLSLAILNKGYYMTNGSVLLMEHPSFFSPISVLHYEYYGNQEAVARMLENNPELQCIVGRGYTPFGGAQKPALGDYADGVDTLQFLLEL